MKKIKLYVNIDSLSVLIPEANKLKVLPRKKKKELKKYVSQKLLIKFTSEYLDI